MASYCSIYRPVITTFCTCSVCKYSNVEDFYHHTMLKSMPTYCFGGRTGLMVRASDSGSGDPGSILGRVGVFVSLSKRHLLPKSTGNTQE